MAVAVAVAVAVAAAVAATVAAALAAAVAIAVAVLQGQSGAQRWQNARMCVRERYVIGRETRQRDSDGEEGGAGIARGWERHGERGEWFFVREKLVTAVVLVYFAKLLLKGRQADGSVRVASTRSCRRGEGSAKPSTSYLYESFSKPNNSPIIP